MNLMIFLVRVIFFISVYQLSIIVENLLDYLIFIILPYFKRNND